MPKHINLEGKIFGELSVIKKVDKNSSGGYNYICKCTCGNEKIIASKNFAYSKKISCGCIRNKLVTKHGLRKHTLYSTWHNIKARCNNINDSSYKNYGGRGIGICNEWGKDFFVFYKWAINNEWEHGLEIDRINNNGNYEPNNCRITTKKVNCNNRRSNVFFTLNGVTKTLAQWSDEIGVLQSTISWRVRNGITAEKVLWAVK